MTKMDETPKITHENTRDPGYRVEIHYHDAIRMARWWGKTAHLYPDAPAWGQKTLANAIGWGSI